VTILADHNGDGQRDSGDSWLGSTNVSMDAPVFSVPLLYGGTGGEPVTLLGTVDIPTLPTVTAAAGLPGTLALLAALGWALPRCRRRWRGFACIAAAGLVVAACLLVPACSGGATGGDGATGEPTVQLGIAAIVAEDSATGAAVSFSGLPAQGSVITVER